jgi:kumamolisin
LKPTATVRRRQSGAIVAIGTAGALLLLSAGSALAATRPPSTARVAVPQGIGAAALQNAQVVGQASPSTTETVSFILKAQHLSALETRVNGGTASHLSVSAFASTYGQTSANISALETFLSGFGITSTPMADGLDVSTTGTVADYNAALGVKQKEYRLAAVPARAGHLAQPAADFHGTAEPTTLPAPIAAHVLSILGLTAYPTGSSNAVHVPALARGVKPAATQKGNLKPSAFASRYNLTPLLKAGHTGQGQTIGIVTLASLTPSNATHFWSSTLKIKTKANRITLDNIDGGAGPVSDKAGSGETTLDVEQSGALAPNADIVVYQAPNTDAGFIDAFATAASDNVAGAVSSSWGESETIVTASVAAHQESTTYAPRSSPPVTAVPMTPPATSAAPTCRWTSRAPARGSRTRAARRCPARSRWPPASSPRSSPPGAGTGCGRPGRSSAPSRRRPSPCRRSPAAAAASAWSRTRRATRSAG